MTSVSPDTPSSSKRMAAYRRRQRKAGLRPVQLWVPDTRTRAFATKCKRQAMSVAKDDPAHKELMRFIEGAYVWPDAE